jgi:hypothetical protein
MHIGVLLEGAEYFVPRAEVEVLALEGERIKPNRSAALGKSFGFSARE